MLGRMSPIAPQNEPISSGLSLSELACGPEAAFDLPHCEGEGLPLVIGLVVWTVARHSPSLLESPGSSFSAG